MKIFNIVNPIELMICMQCGAVVFAPMKNIHGKSHSTFGSFKEFPANIADFVGSLEEGFTETSVEKEGDLER